MQYVESQSNAATAVVATSSLASSSAAEAAAPAGAVGSPVSAGWLVRRAALWMLFVCLGITGSCLLYMAGSQAEADSAPSQRALVNVEKK